MKYYPPRYLFRRYEIHRGLESGRNFLEVGPGKLYLTLELLDYFQRGTLIEYNPNVRSIFNLLPSETKNRLQLHIIDFMAVELEDSFDCAIACEVMEHIDDDRLFLEKLCNLLRDEGQLIVSVPAHASYWSKHDEIVGHVRRYEKEDLRRLLAETGFHRIKILSYGFPFTNLLRIPRVLLAYFQENERSRWSQERQTQESGLMGVGSRFASALGYFVNPYTVLPLCKVASLFNRFDHADGYLVFAEKS